MAIISVDVEASCGVWGSGSACVPASSLRKALASPSGSPVSSDPDVSAWYSRDRLIASWIIPAASGPKMMSSRNSKMFGPSSSRPRPKMAAQRAIAAKNMITLARAAATEEMRMSRL